MTEPTDRHDIILHTRGHSIVGIDLDHRPLSVAYDSQISIGTTGPSVTVTLLVDRIDIVHAEGEQPDDEDEDDERP